MRTRYSVLLLLSFAWVMAISSSASAVDFRVESSVYAEKDAKTPSSTNLTLFHAGRVYDFLPRGPGETPVAQISIFDPLKGRFTLLDPARKVKTDLERDRMVELTGSLRTWASNQSDPLLQFAAAPKFTELAGVTGNETQFTSTVMAYRVVTFEPESPDIARQYREFSDAFARLNTVINPGSLPPFPRLAVNEALAKRNLAPKEVELTIQPRGKVQGKATVRWTRHEFHARLLDADETQIQQAGRLLTELRAVSFDEFVRPSAQHVQR